MKLYYAPGTCALAVHVALIWAGDDYQVEQVVLGSDAYKKINPMGAVPALVDGDSGVMLQADSLLKYISNKYPDAAMGGCSVSSRSTNGWRFWVETCILRFGQSFVRHGLRPGRIRRVSMRYKRRRITACIRYSGFWISILRGATTS